MSAPTRVLVPIDSHANEAFQTALAYADAICQKSGASDIILLTHTKHQLNHTSLSRFLGEKTIRALAKGPLSLQTGVRLHIETMRTIRLPARKSVIIIYYAATDILDLVDGLKNIAGVVAVPDLPGTGDEWARRWGVIVHGQEQQAAPPLIDGPVVVRALESLTSMVNLSTGLGHPRDKDRANETLRILRAKGHADPTPHIKSWAIRQGWRPEGAAALEALSRKVWGLKGKPRLADFYNVHERYARWQDGKG
jgi:hypothetical protein